jgi:2-oxoisovalerate dehydrogenase E2 component (dihydrolipoyl transacylase)
MGTEVIRMPKLGEMMKEGVLVEWIVEAGQTIEAETPIATVNTDKVDVEIESPYSGRVLRLIVEEGATVPVGEPICELEVDGEPA